MKLACLPTSFQSGGEGQDKKTRKRHRFARENKLHKVNVIAGDRTQFIVLCFINIKLADFARADWNFSYKNTCLREIFKFVIGITNLTLNSLNNLIINLYILLPPPFSYHHLMIQRVMISRDGCYKSNSYQYWHSSFDFCLFKPSIW